MAKAILSLEQTLADALKKRERLVSQNRIAVAHHEKEKKRVEKLFRDKVEPLVQAIVTSNLEVGRLCRELQHPRREKMRGKERIWVQWKCLHCGYEQPMPHAESFRE